MDERVTILELLPEALPKDAEEGMIRSVRECDALGGTYEFLTYRRESWCNSFDEEVGWIPYDDQPRPKWTAHCTCGACGSEWHWGWQNASRIIACVDAGETVPGIPEGRGDGKDVDEGDMVPCPRCGERVMAVPASSLRNGRTYRCLMGRVENLGRYTAVVYWILERHVDTNGVSTYGSMPWLAVAIGSDGSIYSYSHTISSMYGKRNFFPSWQSVRQMGEPTNSRYYSWEAYNKTMVGGFYVTDVPDQLGMTGEKTGLAEYLAGNGEFPLAYLKAQRRWPQLENLVKAGWTYTVDAALNEAVHNRYSAEVALRACFDLTKVKPKEILGLPKDGLRWYGRKRWDFHTASLWKTLAGQISPDDFLGITKLQSTYDIKNAAFQFGAEALPKVCAYLQKQNGASLGYYLDYRRMLAEVGGGESQVELYPPHLRAAHDRVTMAKKAQLVACFDAKFEAMAERWAALEWSDGEICAVLPRKGFDLTQEGKTLHHCVGGYQDQHVAGKLIIFIRHARRPERSWYTLNVDVTGPEWREVQLHGYGNEYAHGKRLRIPREVREFVDRWEREVLAPTFRRVKKESERKKEAAA